MASDSKNASQAGKKPSLAERAAALRENMGNQGLSPEVRAGIQAVVSGRPTTPAVVDSAVGARKEAQGPSMGLNAFKSLVSPDPTKPENIERYSSIFLLMNVIGLLRNVAVAKKLNFDTDNLHKILQAVFSKAMNKKLSKQDVQAWLRIPTKEWSGMNIVFFNVLGCTTESTEDEIRGKIDHLATEVKRLEQLSSYEEFQGLLKDFGAISDGTKTIEAVISDAKTKDNEPKTVFDDAILDTMLSEVEQTPEPVVTATPESVAPEPVVAPEPAPVPTPVPTPIPAPEPVVKATPEPEEVEIPLIDYVAFYAKYEHSPALTPLRRLFEAFQAVEEEYDTDFKNQYFGGRELTAVVDKIDFGSDLRTGLGHELLIAALDGSDPSALVATVAKNFGLERDPEGLKLKLSQIHDQLGQDFLDILDDSDPLKMKLHVDSIPPVDYNDFYDSLGADQETLFAYRPLYNLYGALHDEGVRYDAKYKDQHFGGKTLDEVETELEATLGFELADKIIHAAESKEWKTTLIKAIAEHFGVANNTDALREKLKEIHQILGGQFPGILDEADPLLNPLGTNIN